MMSSPTIIFGVFISLVALGGAQDRHWEETAKETIWRGRYTNCDKGWAVDLPPGVVAHDSLPPSPNHGFLVSAADPAKTAEVTFDDQRIVNCYDNYDAMDDESDSGEPHGARAYLDWELKRVENKVALEIREVELQGLQGVEARYRVKLRGAEQVVEILIFLRGDVVYHLALRTTDRYYKSDSALFARLRAGFRVLPFPKGECANP